MALKLPRTIRLDPSDTFVYACAAEPGEWAVTGTFLFFGIDPVFFDEFLIDLQKFYELISLENDVIILHSGSPSEDS